MVSEEELRKYLPPVPDGYELWVYKGLEYRTRHKVWLTCIRDDLRPFMSGNMPHTDYATANAGCDQHYFIAEKAEPQGQIIDTYEL